MLLIQIPIVSSMFIYSFSIYMDTLTCTLVTIIYFILAAVIIWLVRGYYKRHTYECNIYLTFIVGHFIKMRYLN